MGKKETPIQAEIFRTIGQRDDVRLFRNNIGMATHKDGSCVKYGLCNPGGSDLIGLTTKTITADMVGKKIAIFTALETKAEKKKGTPNQNNFICEIKKRGGLAGIARNIEDAKKIIDKGLVNF